MNRFPRFRRLRHLACVLVLAAPLAAACAPSRADDAAPTPGQAADPTPAAPGSATPATAPPASSRGTDELRVVAAANAATREALVRGAALPSPMADALVAARPFTTFAQVQIAIDATSVDKLLAWAKGAYANDFTVSMLVGGYVRTAVLHLPPALVGGGSGTAAGVHPLVVGLHGHFGSGSQFLGQTTFASHADARGLIGVFPDGLPGATGEAGRGWNDGRAPDLVDDVGFIRALVADLAFRMPVDRARITAMGMSNGGIFTERLGCEMADVFSALAPDVGAMAQNLAATCRPALPVAIVGLQGIADPYIPIGGGTVGSPTGGAVLSADATMKLWAQKNGCAGMPTTTALPPTIADGTSVSRSVFAGCTSGVEVDYYLVAGMGHVWPPEDGGATAQTTSKNIDATATFLDFFAKHPRGATTACPPATCKSIGKTCGIAPDGCGGTLSCGTCTSPQTCGGGGVANVCGNGTTCTPRTCAAGQCGIIDDGCNGKVSCAGCPLGQTCGGGGVANVCGGGTTCAPRTCGAGQCGIIDDGCGGKVSCAGCPAGQACGAGALPNVCAPTGGSAPACVNPSNPTTCDVAGPFGNLEEDCSRTPSGSWACTCYFQGAATKCCEAPAQFCPILPANRSFKCCF